MTRILNIVWITLITTTGGLAQKLDSLYLLREVFQVTLPENPEKSIRIANEMLSLARQLQDKEAEGEALYNIGYGHYVMGHNAQAIQFYQQAREVLSSTPNHKLLGTVYNAIGNFYVEVEDYATALLQYNRALTLFHDPVDQVKTYNNIGSVNIFLKRYDSAEFYFEKMLQLSRNNPEQKLVYLGNLAYIRYETGRYPNAIDFYRQSIRQAEALKQERYLPRLYKNLADCFLRNGEYDSCSTYLNKCLVLSRESKRYAQEADALLSYSSYYDTLKQTDRAIEMAEQASRVIEQASAYNKGKLFAQLSHLYHTSGNLAKALEYEKRHTHYLDSVRLVNQQHAIQADSEMAAATKGGRKFRADWLGYLILPLVILGFFLYKHSRKVDKKATQDAGPEILQEGKYMKGQYQGGETLLNLTDIIWFEKIDRAYYACLANEKYRVRPTITELETLLPGTFVRINRAVIINLAFLLNYSPWENNKYVVRMKVPEGTEFVATRDRIRKIEEHKATR